MATKNNDINKEKNPKTGYFQRKDKSAGLMVGNKRNASAHKSISIAKNKKK